jgi:hypothetical protein
MRNRIRLLDGQSSRGATPRVVFCDWNHIVTSENTTLQDHFDTLDDSFRILQYLLVS